MEKLFLSLEFMSQPLLVSNFPSWASSPLSALTKLERVTVLFWMRLWLKTMSLSKLWELVMDREAWSAASMGLQRVRHDWATELNWTELNAMASGSPGGSVVKNLPASTGDTRDVGSIAGSGRSPGEGHGNPLQNSCLENPLDRGDWQATVHGLAKSQAWLSDWVCTQCYGWFDLLSRTLKLSLDQQ